mgnify:CR=1 FL=1
MSKDLEMSYLLDFYGDVLTEKQRDVMEQYYNDDLSLAEIAEEIGISRQGVRELIKKAEEELRFYEEKLGLCYRFRQAQQSAEELLALLRQAGVEGEVFQAAEALAEKIR